MDLPSVLGGAVQGFKDFGTGLVDFFGGGTASVLDLIDAIQTGKVGTHKDDFRKWLYNTDDSQDAAAKGLGTILNGVQTVSDYIPGVNIVSQNPLFNAGQGFVGGIADEFKQYGKDYDLGRAAQRGLVSGGAALASGELGKTLGASSNPLLQTNTVKGAARGALGGAINQGGYTAIEGGSLADVLNSAKQGATMGGLIGGTTGMIQDFKPAKTYATGLTDDEKAARIANAKNMLANEQNPERIAELNAQIERLGGGASNGKVANDPQAMQAIDAILSPEQQAYFQDSVIRDADGKLTPVYHSSPNKFTAFDDSRLGQNTMYENTGFGHFVTTDPDFSQRFRDIGNTGAEGNTMELYANVKNPITHPYMAHHKYSGDELEKILVDYYNAVGNPDAIDMLRDYAAEDGASLYDEYMSLIAGDESPFEDVKGEREALKKAGYDAVEFVEGLKKDLVENSTDTTPISSYAVFNGNQLKDINNLKPTNNPDIMEAIDAIVAPNQDPLISDIINKDTSRAREIILNNDYKKSPVSNELYDKIDPSTLPKGYDKLRKFLDAQNDPENSMTALKIKEQFGTTNLDKVDTNKLLDYVYGANSAEKRNYQADLKKSIDIYKSNAKGLGMASDNAESVVSRSKRMELIGKANEKATNDAIADIVSMEGLGDDVIHALTDYKNRTIRGGYNGALDTALSERLGIAPGNTIKIDSDDYLAYSDSPNSTGRYMKGAKDIDINRKRVAARGGTETAVSAMAHERLHSFQNEAQPENLGRYSKEVTDAYKELSEDLKPFLKNEKEIKQRYKDGRTEYWLKQGEQESRMLQNYLENKKITSDALYGSNTKGEWGNEINPAFDKFFNKLRKLSKKGVALPAITALLGGGAYLTTTADEKDKEIR